MYLQQLIMNDDENNERIKSIDFDWTNPYSASKLARAVRSKNLALVKKLIEECSSLDEPDNRGWTALHEASLSDDYSEMARCLISAGAYIEHKTVDGETPLFIACKNGAENIAQMLIDACCIVNTRNNDSSTPLHVACSKRNGSIINALLNNGADIEAQDIDNATPIFCAIEYENDLALNILLKAGANLDFENCHNQTPLLCSCRSGNIKIFFMIIEHLGCDKSIIDKQNSEGWTPLMEAIQDEKYPIIEKLLEYGCDTSLVDNRDLLALHLAAHCKNYNIFKLILESTSPAAIEKYCVFRNDTSEYRSLTCLLIDVDMYDGLELLFGSGFSEDVLSCPIKLDNTLYSPISFLLEYSSSLTNSKKKKYLEFLIKYDFMLDPCYTVVPKGIHIFSQSSHENHFLLNIDSDNFVAFDGVLSHSRIYGDGHYTLISPILAAIRCHTPDHTDCSCNELLSMILGRGVNTDICASSVMRLIRGISNGFLLYDECIMRSFLHGLKNLLKYSNHYEPGDVLLSLIKKVPYFFLDEEITDFLFSKSVFQMNHLASILNEKIRHAENGTDRTWYKGYQYLLSKLKKTAGSHPLKEICRASVRQHIRLHCRLDGIPMREYIQNMVLPFYIKQYILYEVEF